MTGAWAARIPLAQSDSLGRLRLIPSLQAGATDDALWVRGPESEDAIARVRMIPHAELFHLNENGGLRPWDRLLNTGTLPDIEFNPLVTQTQPQVPPAGWPTAQVAPISLALVRSEQTRPAAVLETSLSAWTAWALAAPLVRLRRWTFAAADDDRALVRGTPIPPLPGQQYWETDGVAVPVGWECCPNISGAVLTAVVAPEPGGLVLLAADGSADTIPASAFVAVTRSALRSTQSRPAESRPGFSTGEPCDE